MKKLKIILLILALIIFVIGIFLFSNQNGKISSITSEKVLRVIINVFNQKFKYLTALEQSNIIQKYHLLFRKFAHVAEFLILTQIVYFVIQFFVKRWYSILITFFSSIALAIIDEFHQTFIPGRNGTYKDVIIDSIGIGVGILICIAIYTIKNSRNKNKEQL